MTDAPLDDSADEAASLEEPPAQAPQKAARPSRKNVGAKTSSKQSPKRKSKRTTRATSTAQVKVGSHTIVLAKSLATNLKPKDLRKLRAIFKRAGKRGKKRTAAKRARKR